MRGSDTHIASFFTPFEDSIAEQELPECFVSPFHVPPHPICLVAVQQLQKRLEREKKWTHNFGLEAGKKGRVIGKMFGVLVVRMEQGKLGYLAAFSGKLGGSNEHAGFVPPIFDGLQEGGFLNAGMEELGRINQEIRTLEALDNSSHSKKIEALKEHRKNHSNALQAKLYDHYRFLNQAGELKDLRAIFQEARQQKPPAGAGECAAPKLLQYAFLHKLQPIALAEFWWGQSPKSEHWKHGEFYPVCEEKCQPILGYMLKGL